jgi:hypothetical protein
MDHTLKYNTNSFDLQLEDGSSLSIRKDSNNNNTIITITKGNNVVSFVVNSGYNSLIKTFFPDVP